MGAASASLVAAEPFGSLPAELEDDREVLRLGEISTSPGARATLRIEERVPERGTRRAPVSTKTWVPILPVLPLEWPFPAATLLFSVRNLWIEERELEAGGLN